MKRNSGIIIGIISILIIIFILMCGCCCCFLEDTENETATIKETKVETENKESIEEIKTEEIVTKETPENEKQKLEQSMLQYTEEEDKIENTTKSKFSEKLGEDTSLYFESALKECNFNIDEVKSLKEEFDWTSGKVYSFNYGNFDYGYDNFELYVFENGQICSINYNDIKIYDYSKSSLNVYDFFEPNFVNAEMAIYIQDIVNTCLNYPNYAKYEAYTFWGCKKVYDYYIIYSTVNAPNAFGMYEDVIFRVDLKKDDTTFTPKCVAINQKIIMGKDETPEIIREDIERNILEKSDENSIILTYNQLGEYGKQGEYDIEYYLPVGTYIINKHSGMGFFIQNINNEDDFEMYKFDENGDTITISIKDNYYLGLMVNTTIEVQKQ